MQAITSLLGGNFDLKIPKVAQKSILKSFKLHEKLFDRFYSYICCLHIYDVSVVKSLFVKRLFGLYFRKLEDKNLQKKVQDAKKEDQLAQFLPLKNVKTSCYLSEFF